MRAFFRNRVVRNAGWLIAGRLGQMLISFFVSLLTMRYLGPSNYGLLSYATAYLAFFSAVSSLGIHSVLVKELLDRPEEQGTAMGTALCLRVAASVLSVLLLVCVTSLADHGEPVTIAVVSLSALSLIFQSFELLNDWFQARLQSRVTAVVTLAAFTMTALYKIVLLVYGRSVRYFALATSVDYLLLGVFLLLAYRRYHGDRLRFSASYARTLLRQSWHFILPTLMICVYEQTDKLMLKHFFSEAEVGYYATAAALCNVWCFALLAIIDSMTPVILEASGKERFARENERLYAIVFYLSLLMSVLYTVFAAPVVRFLYGEAYLPAVKPLRILTWYTAFAYLGTARNVWIVSKGYQKYLFFVYLAAAAVNISLNFLLIPSMGASGAAIASLVAQAATIFAAPLLFRPLRENVCMMLRAVTLRRWKEWWAKC